MSRLGTYFILLLTVTAYLVWVAIAESQANMPNDPSSMAWTGFLPFLIPIFMVQALLYVAPVAAVIELILWLGRGK